MKAPAAPIAIRVPQIFLAAATLSAGYYPAKAIQVDVLGDVLQQRFRAHPPDRCRMNWNPAQRVHLVERCLAARAHAQPDVRKGPARRQMILGTIALGCMSRTLQGVSSTSLFVLACLELAGKKTLPQLREFTGLSTGILSPSLRALQQAGLVELSSGARGRVNIGTIGAEAVLTAHWKEYLDQIDLELESVLRLAWVALRMGMRTGEPHLAVEYVRAAANYRHQQLGIARDQESSFRVSDLAGGNFSSMRALARLHRLQAEELTLRALERALSRFDRQDAEG
jgi:DNA-binding MarR family transcriptional regulator